MTTSTEHPSTILDIHCIDVTIGQDDFRLFTVAEYDALQRQPYNRPLWARRVDPVEQLTDEGHWPYPPESSTATPTTPRGATSSGSILAPALQRRRPPTGRMPKEGFRAW